MWYALQFKRVVFFIQDKIKALQEELQVVSNSKTLLEKELQEVITLTSTELEDYQEKVMELEDEVNYCKIIWSVYVNQFIYLELLSLVYWENIISSFENYHVRVSSMF